MARLSGSYHWPKHSTDSPNQASRSHIDRSLLHAGGDGQIRETTQIHAAAADTGDGASDDESIHGFGSTAQGGADLEEEDMKDVQPFDVEDAVRFTPRQNGGGRSEGECDAEPSQGVNLVETLEDCRLNVGNNGIVQTEKKGG